MAPVKVVAGADAFGEKLKNSAVDYLKSKPELEVVDLGTDEYYVVAEKVARIVSGKMKASDAGVPGCVGDIEADVRGLVVCGTGAGVNIVANKFPGISTVCCDSADAAKNARSINNCNVLSLSGLYMKPEEFRNIIDAWLETKFKAPCPANNNQPWSEEISGFLDKSLPDVASITPSLPSDACPICDLASARVYKAVQEMPGGSWHVIRENPTTALVRFKKGTIEPKHHHTCSHDIYVTLGHKAVENVTFGKTVELKPGDFLSTPAGSEHCVYYYEDTEFLIKFDGPADILLDEDAKQPRRLGRAFFLPLRKIIHLPTLRKTKEIFKAMGLSKSYD